MKNKSIFFFYVLHGFCHMSRLIKQSAFSYGAIPVWILLVCGAVTPHALILTVHD